MESGGIKKEYVITLRAKIRRHPIACIIVALFSWMSWRIRRRKLFVGKTIQMEDGKQFVVFRHIYRKCRQRNESDGSVVMVVRFRFARFSQIANRRLSLIPVPMIAGYPGFHDKVWMFNENDGYWQGVYQWESEAAVDSYKHSFVLGIMNRRAAEGTLTISAIPNTSINDYLLARLIPDTGI